MLIHLQLELKVSKAGSTVLAPTLLNTPFVINRGGSEDHNFASLTVGVLAVTFDMEAWGVSAN